MTDLSDRQRDIFDNASKMACREGNLRVLHEAAYLLWEDGDRTRLRCDWCELMGEVISSSPALPRGVCPRYDSPGRQRP